MTDKISAEDSTDDWNKALCSLLTEGWTADLVQLLKTDKPIPPTVRNYLANILDGATKLPDRRGKSNSSLSPDDKEVIRLALYTLYHNTETVLIFADQLADERGEEVIDLRQSMEKARRDGVKKLAEKYGLSENTVRTYHEAKHTINWAWCWAGKNDLQASDGTVLPGFLDAPETLQRAALYKARTYLKYPEKYFDPLME
ncbi:MAG: hypothetical protein WBD81_15635 [Collimonas pratensis]|uniref:hypothetical protein n=1 Tax=Collimonas pratensis TaxID=279113 RepID=UPI003C794E7B